MPFAVKYPDGTYRPFTRRKPNARGLDGARIFARKCDASRCAGFDDWIGLNREEKHGGRPTVVEVRLEEVS